MKRFFAWLTGQDTIKTNRRVTGTKPDPRRGETRLSILNNQKVDRRRLRPRTTRPTSDSGRDGDKGGGGGQLLLRGLWRGMEGVLFLAAMMFMAVRGGFTFLKELLVGSQPYFPYAEEQEEPDLENRPYYQQDDTNPEDSLDDLESWQQQEDAYQDNFETAKIADLDREEKELPDAERHDQAAALRSFLTFEDRKP